MRLSMTDETSHSTTNPLLSVLTIDSEQGLASIQLPENFDSEITQETLQKALQDANIAEWSLNESGIVDLIQKAKKGLASQTLVATRKDAAYRIKISRDSMTASLDIDPQMGGQPLDVEKVKADLQNHGIQQSCLKLQVLSSITNVTEHTRLVVATGKAAVAGRDSQFIALIEKEDEEAEFVEDSAGNVDFRSGHEYITVAENTPLLKREPPTSGERGMDVFGNPIDAKPGKEISFDGKMDGTYANPEDPNIILAKVGGHPVFSKKGVRVDPTLKFKDVDLSTGHINFDGSVHVSGDVRPEMKIEASGDVFIKGMVEGATIISGNDVNVGLGIAGSKTEDDEETENPEYDCQIHARGTVTARYANLAHIETTGSVHIKEYIFNSYVKAGSRVLLGQQGGKGNIVGGQTIAGHAIVARSLGSNAYVKTELRVGANNQELLYLEELHFTREQRLAQARSIRALLNQLKERSKQENLGEMELHKAKKMHQTLLDIQEQIKKIEIDFQKITYIGTHIDEPNITATHHCYPNCFVTINGAVMKVDAERRTSNFINQGRKITLKS